MELQLVSICSLCRVSFSNGRFPHPVMENEDSGEKNQTLTGIFEQILNYIVSESLCSGF